MGRHEETPLNANEIELMEEENKVSDFTWLYKRIRALEKRVEVLEEGKNT